MNVKRSLPPRPLDSRLPGRAKTLFGHEMAPTSQNVIPAKAEIQGRGGGGTPPFGPSPPMDSRFRGNDVL